AGEGYCSESYKWGHCGFHHLSKYCPSDKSDYWSGTGSPDDKIVLDPEDDAAHVKLGGKWRIPTCKEWRELSEKCKWTYVSDINGTGVSGRLVTGPNGNSIFLPAAGYLRDTSLRDAGTAGNYWSSTLYSFAPNAAYCTGYGSTRIDRAEIRCFGLSVRPVF
ncbi:MAG: hypothetical protein IJU69_04490, partial [Bacteroidales bacterium]|nr:hypothetical protein [Bacteroidales bacterium]